MHQIALTRSTFHTLVASCLTVGLLAALPRPALAFGEVKRKDIAELSGPRIGLTYVTPGEDARNLKRELAFDTGYPGALLSQFGWQFEYRFFEQSNGLIGLNEFVLLIGGLDQAAILPAASWLIGVRMPSGFEFGAGPTLVVAQLADSIKEGTFGLGEGKKLGGVSFAGAIGYNFKSGDVNFPLNLAVVRTSPSREPCPSCSDTGYHISFLIGFSREKKEEEKEPVPDVSPTLWVPKIRENAEKSFDDLEEEEAARGESGTAAETVTRGQSGEATRPKTEPSPAELEPPADNSPRSLEDMTTLLERDDTAVAREVLEELEERKGKSTLPALMPVFAAGLKHSNSKVAKEALSILIKKPQPPAKEFLTLLTEAIIEARSDATAEVIYKYILQWKPKSLPSIQRRLAREAASKKVREHASRQAMEDGLNDAIETID